MTNKNEKIPKYSPQIHPKDREIRIEKDPISNRDKNPCWQIGKIDVDGKWGWRKVSGALWWEDIKEKLKNFESMTWQEIFDASGGRGSGKGNNNHEVLIKDLIPEARKRLKELGYNDIDTLFSLRLTGKQRIWGILSGKVLKIIWFDPNHEICPSMRN